MTNRYVHRVSRLFQPMNLFLKNSEPKIGPNDPKGYESMVRTGIIKQVNPGMYALLPLAQRALEKLVKLVDREMENIGAQKIQLPVLTPTALWEKTERLAKAGPELFTLKDHHGKHYVMSPTYEEAITNLIAETGDMPSSIFPLFLYQISRKWRDEMKPRLGLLRGREFVMKDLYSFDKNQENAEMSYNLVCQSYKNIFEKIGIKCTKAIGDTGIMGGLLSHEFHYLTNIGEDVVLQCTTCDYAINKAVSESVCPHCKKDMTVHLAVEVGHTFLLDTTYSKPFKATFKEAHKDNPLSMGCYGLGLTRLLATSVEILSTPTEIRWPTILAPYTVCIIGPKKGSKEEHASRYVEDIYHLLADSNVDVIIDDRSKQTIGRRMLEAKTTGYPFVVVVGRLAAENTPKFELHDVCNSKCENLDILELHSFFAKNATSQQLKRNVVSG